MMMIMAIIRVIIFNLGNFWRQIIEINDNEQIIMIN